MPAPGKHLHRAGRTRRAPPMRLARWFRRLGSGRGWSRATARSMPMGFSTSASCRAERPPRTVRCSPHPARIRGRPPHRAGPLCVSAPAVEPVRRTGQRRGRCPSGPPLEYPRDEVLVISDEQAIHQPAPGASARAAANGANASTTTGSAVTVSSSSGQGHYANSSKVGTYVVNFLATHWACEKSWEIDCGCCGS